MVCEYSCVRALTEQRSGRRGQYLRVWWRAAEHGGWYVNRVLDVGHVGYAGYVGYVGPSVTLVTFTSITESILRA